MINLPDDDQYKIDNLEALRLLDRLQTTAALNKILGTHYGPYDWDDLPAEVIDMAIAWANEQQESD